MNGTPSSHVQDESLSWWKDGHYFFPMNGRTPEFTHSGRRGLFLVVLNADWVKRLSTNLTSVMWPVVTRGGFKPVVTPHGQSKARACPCHPVCSEAVLPPHPHQAASIGRQMACLFFKTRCDMITLHLNKTISTRSRRSYCLPWAAASCCPAASTQKHTHTPHLPGA